MPPGASLAPVALRDWLRPRRSIVEPARDEMYRCPCCDALTLDERGGYDLCPVCFWEDDGQGDHDADEVRGGPNGWLSLTEARRNYAEIGACHREFLENVRPPGEDERRGG